MITLLEALETLTKQQLDGDLPGVIAVGASTDKIILYVKSKMTKVPSDVGGVQVVPIVIKNVQPAEN